MDDNKIPYIAFEAEMARHERTIRRLLIALVIAIAVIFIVYKAQEKLFKHLNKH